MTPYCYMYCCTEGLCAVGQRRGRRSAGALRQVQEGEARRLPGLLQGELRAARALRQQAGAGRAPPPRVAALLARRPTGACTGAAAGRGGAGSRGQPWVGSGRCVRPSTSTRGRWSWDTRHAARAGPSATANIGVTAKFCKFRWKFGANSPPAIAPAAPRARGASCREAASPGL